MTPAISQWAVACFDLNNSTAKQNKSNGRRGDPKRRGGAAGPRSDAPSGFRALSPRFTINPVYTPAVLRRTLRYVDNCTNTTGAGSLALTYFSANSLYDPYYAVGGHQPMGFDQVMALYQKYTVVASRISITAVIQSVPQVVGIQVFKGTATAYSSYNGMIETGLVVHKVTDVDDTSVKLTTTQLTSASLGIINPLDDDPCSGTASASPVNNVMFAVWNQDVNKTSVAIAQFVVTIDYDAIFTEPTQLAQS